MEDFAGNFDGAIKNLLKKESILREELVAG